MKTNIIIILLLLFVINFGFAQKVIIYFESPKLRVVDVPTYLFQGGNDINSIEITDSLFLNYLSKVIDDMVKCDSSCCQSHIWTSMIQIVYIKNQFEYDIINMTHGLYDTNNTGHYLDNGCLELNGKIMKYIDEFQEIIDNIVNFHIVNPKYNVNNDIFLKSIINGKRFHVTPYPPSFPIQK